MASAVSLTFGLTSLPIGAQTTPSCNGFSQTYYPLKRDSVKRDSERWWGPSIVNILDGKSKTKVAGTVSCRAVTGNTLISESWTNTNGKYNQSKSQSKDLPQSLRGVQIDSFAVRFEGEVALEAGVYKLALSHDDGVRVFVDDKKVYEPSTGDTNKKVGFGSIDQWFNRESDTFAVAAGKNTKIKVYYANQWDGGFIKIDANKQVITPVVDEPVIEPIDPTPTTPEETDPVVVDPVVTPPATTTETVCVGQPNVNPFITNFTPSPISNTVVTPTNDTQVLLQSLLGNAEGLSQVTLDYQGNAVAVGTFNGGPFGFGNGVALSTGQVKQIQGPNNNNYNGTAFDTYAGSMLNGKPRQYDKAQINIKFFADANTDKINFRYVFGSEEFRTYSGSTFNDIATLEVNGVNYAKLTDGKDLTINNLTPKSQDNTLDSSDYIENAPRFGESIFYPNPASRPGAFYENTELNGFTKPLLFTAPLIPNSWNTLSLSVADISDNRVDSAFLLQGNSVSTKPPVCTTVTVPVTTPAKL